MLGFENNPPAPSTCPQCQSFSEMVLYRCFEMPDFITIKYLLEIIAPKQICAFIRTHKLLFIHLVQ